MRRRSSVVLAACLVAPVLAIGMSGCAKSTKTGQIRARPAPEMVTLDKTAPERRNNWAVVRGTNVRNFNSSVARFFYIDRPSRLSPTPIPH
jgi:hypothetical protein